jgi:ATP-dependent RNA helicase RhlE
MFTGAVPQDESLAHVAFSELGLSEPIERSLSDLEFNHPTPIQAAVIPVALEGLDLIGLAQTGSGKTAAFSLPLAERLRHGENVRGLILSPTREIALQTQSFLEVVGRDHELRTVLLIGGVKLGPQIDDLRQNPDIVVATPGRLWDQYERRNVRLDRIRHVVLDEADHMLDLGFLPQIQRILQALPEKRQTMMFSATMPPQIESISQRFMSDPQIIDLRPEYRLAEGIEHRLYLVDNKDTRNCLMALALEETGSMLIFLRRKVDCEWAYRHLVREGHSVERIHSDRSQSQRVDALQGLRNGKHRILLATNIAARGIDIPTIEHIVNFGMTDTVEDYVHRAGRTARGSMEGTVSTIATWRDKEVVRQVEKAIGRPLPRCTVEGIEPWQEAKRTIRGRERIRRKLL